MSLQEWQQFLLTLEMKYGADALLIISAANSADPYDPPTIYFHAEQKAHDEHN